MSAMALSELADLVLTAVRNWLTSSHQSWCWGGGSFKQL